MIQHRIVDRIFLMQKLNEMTCQYVDELQIRHLFNLYGNDLKFKEEGDSDAVQTNSRESQ